jgi:hypothetical protein
MRQNRKYISPYHPLPYPLLLGEDNDDKDGNIGHPLPRPLPLGEDKDGNDDEINNSLPDRSPQGDDKASINANETEGSYLLHGDDKLGHKTELSVHGNFINIELLLMR